MKYIRVNNNYIKKCNNYPLLCVACNDKFNCNIFIISYNRSIAYQIKTNNRYFKKYELKKGKINSTYKRRISYAKRMLRDNSIDYVFEKIKSIFWITIPKAELLRLKKLI